MIFEEWAETVGRDFSAMVNSLSLDADTLRSGLVAVHTALLQAPDYFNAAYAVLSEHHIDHAEGLWLDHIIANDQVQLANDSTEDLIPVFAGLARALDTLLLRYAPTGFGPPEPDDLLDELSGCHVIPRKRPRGEFGLNQGYRRRGLRHHRIIPGNVDSRTVKIYWSGQMSVDLNLPAMHAAAAIFPSLKLHIEPISRATPASGFRASHLDAGNQKALITEQIIDALAGGSLALVWPELTMPPDLSALVEKTLKHLALESGPSPLQVVVTGSWHVDQEGKTYNLAAVLDGNGQEICQYRKMYPFTSADTGPEAITPGNELPVILTDDFVFSVGICKDFCQLTRTQLLLGLDVDVYLVPSMGETRTMDGHRATAKSLRDLGDIRSFVVQQPDDTKRANQVSYVLGMPNDPMHADAVTHQRDALATYPSNFT